jgi:photosystem II stability/assembly factor-like uncharacterized protein
MKKFLLLFFIVATLTAQEKWEVQRYKDIAPVKDIFFIGAEGWAVGQSIIYYSSDYGKNWIFQTSSSDARLYSVYFVNTQHGWAVGAAGTIMHTTNGGRMWKMTKSAKSIIFTSVCFTDDMNGWIVGRDDTKHVGVVLRTSNGGKEWIETQISSKQNSFVKVFFLDKQKGWIIGAYPNIVCRTTDGGVSWSEVELNLHGEIKSIYFNDENVGWICGGYYDRTNGSESILLKSSDGGKTWNELPAKFSYQLTDIQFIDENNGFCVGYAPAIGCGVVSPFIIKTTSGGEHWLQQNITQNLFLSSIFIGDDDNAWVVGEDNFGHGAILHTKFSFETDVNETDLPELISITPNPATDYIDVILNGTQWSEESIEGWRSQSIQVYNVLGNVVLTLTPALSLKGEGVRIDVSGLAAGVYFVRVGGKMYKFVKM